MANTLPIQNGEFATGNSDLSIQLFVERVKQVPGVVSVTRYRDAGISEERVTVVVSNLFSTITHEVIRAQESVYDAIPGVRFSLDIKDSATVKKNEL